MLQVTNVGLRFGDKELYKDVKPGSKVLIDDGAIELVVDEIAGKDIVCTVVHGNGLGSRKTINLPGTAVRLPALKQKDIDDLKTACEHGYDSYTNVRINDI